MKRLLSLFTMVIFMTGAVFAQTSNLSAVTQDGDDNESTVEQTGDNNVSRYDVQGDDNIFLGTQDNTGTDKVGNEMHIDQVNAWDHPSNGNEIIATQIGDENDLDVFTQGHGNVLTFIQEGIGNQIKGPNSYSASFTEMPFRARTNYSNIYIEQLGQNNVVVGNLQGNYQDVDVNQESGGTGNRAEVNVLTPWPDAALTTVDIDQDGENFSDVDIDGEGNTVRHNQYGNQEGPEIGMNEATTYIEGDGNTSSIEQEGQNDRAGGSSGITSGWHKITGDNNQAYTEQDGNDNLGYIRQSSDGNYAKQLQDAWNTIPGTKDGNNEADRNESWIYQVHGTGNHAETYQFGDDNWTRIYQDGPSNTAIVDQGIWDQQRPAATGYGASHGYGNQADIMQSGQNNWSHVIQNGSNNVANVTQTQ